MLVSVCFNGRTASDDTVTQQSPSDWQQVLFQRIRKNLESCALQIHLCTNLEELFYQHDNTQVKQSHREKVESINPSLLN